MEDPLPALAGISRFRYLLAAQTGTDIAVRIIALVALILLSAFFSATETAYTGANRVKLKNSAEGNKRAGIALRLLERYDTLLYAMLIGNNIVNLAAASLATVLFIDLLGGNYGLGSVVSTASLTVAILIFGEITPKTLAKRAPERYAAFTCHITYCFVVILTPLCALFELWKKLILKIFKVREDEGITEEELITIVEEAGEEGVLEEDETTLIRSAIEFDDLDVADIYIPRVNVIAIEKNTPMSEIQALFLEHSFSRLPVFDGDIDHVFGMLHEHDFYAALARGEKNIEGCISPIALATEHMKISILLKSLQKQKVHMAVVVDEYGGTCGIVTLEDILEELVGEIWDEHDEVVNYFDKLSDTMYIVDGNAELDDFFELFSLENADEEFDANTVGGWVCEKLEDIPHVNDDFVYGNLKITVLETDHTRVLAVRVEILPEDDRSEKE